MLRTPNFVDCKDVCTPVVKCVGVLISCRRFWGVVENNGKVVEGCWRLWKVL